MKICLSLLAVLFSCNAFAFEGDVELSEKKNYKILSVSCEVDQPNFKINGKTVTLKYKGKYELGGVLPQDEIWLHNEESKIEKLENNIFRIKHFTPVSAERGLSNQTECVLPRDQGDVPDTRGFGSFFVLTVAEQ